MKFSLIFLFVFAFFIKPANASGDFDSVKSNILPAVERLIKSRQYDAAISLAENFSQSNDADLLYLLSYAREEKYLKEVNEAGSDDFYKKFVIYGKLCLISVNKDYCRKRDFYQEILEDRNVSDWGMELISRGNGTNPSNINDLYPKAGYIHYGKDKYETEADFKKRSNPKYEGLATIGIKPTHSYDPDNKMVGLYISIYDSELNFEYYLDSNNKYEYFYNSRESNLMGESTGILLKYFNISRSYANEDIHHYYLYSDSFLKLKGNHCAAVKDGSHRRKIGIEFEASPNKARYLENHAEVLMMIRKPVSRHNFAYTYERVRGISNGDFYQTETSNYYMLSEVIGFIIFDKLKNIIILECTL